MIGPVTVGDTIRFSKLPVRITEVLISTPIFKTCIGKDPENRALFIKQFNLINNEEAFRREVKAYQLIGSHPKIVTMLDYTEGSHNWGAILFEHCADCDLRDFITEKEINEDKVMVLLSDLILALHHIHQKNLSHRNLKPENIIVTVDLKFKLANFQSSISEEEVNGLYGPDLSEDIEANTPVDYRSPEQLDLIPGYPVGIQVDMWGLGCLLYELLYKEHPFGQNLQDQLRGNFKTENKHMKAWWRGLFTRLFEVNPRERATSLEIITLIHDKKANKNQDEAAEESSKSSGLSSIFMKSSNSWVKAVTADNDHIPDTGYLNKLIEKAWKKPFKISKFYKSLMNRSIDKGIVAMKALYVLHKYFMFGPRQVLMAEDQINQFLECVQHSWESPNKSKKDKQTDYFRDLIKEYSSILKEKHRLHIETRTLGNWTDNEINELPQIEALLTYWRKLIRTTESFFSMKGDLSRFWAIISALLLEEQERLDLLTKQSLKQVLPSDKIADLSSIYNQNQQSTLSLITVFRQNNPAILLPQFSVLQQNKNRGSIVDVLKNRRLTQPIYNERRVSNEKINTGEARFSNREEFKSPAEAKSATLGHGTECSSEAEPYTTCTSQTILQTPETPKSINGKPLSKSAKKADPWASFQESPWIIHSNELTREEEIGSGSSCTVYKGLYRYTPVAIKVMRNSSIPGAMENEFNREITTMMRLRHPNLVLFMGACIESQFSIVTEFCAGGSLFKLLYEDREVKLSWKQRIKIAKDVAYGMAYLHGNNPPIIYRDLKSLNLLLAEPVTSPSDNVLIKIADFGISKFIEDEHMTGLMGTCHWMAPEVLASQPYSLEADVYSFGVVLWEILSRETPYRGVNPATIPYKVLQLGERPDITKIPQTTPVELRDLITTCWSSNQKDRPSFSKILEILNTLTF
ncbi:unnamed protein product [Blepharisma stoltei]|uniref:Protein kinase domain-containing protein n=1 Tax=Blepharisma stoltei TaxID=1481888 RepID=A0AAU9ILL6_9CILI|nr:unnamed protein product [Blepharisma stoltei]